MFAGFSAMYTIYKCKSDSECAADNKRTSLRCLHTRKISDLHKMYVSCTRKDTTKPKDRQTNRTKMSKKKKQKKKKKKQPGVGETQEAT